MSWPWRCRSASAKLRAFMAWRGRSPAPVYDLLAPSLLDWGRVAVTLSDGLADHAVRTQEHFSEVKAGQQAGGVTYYGFLSVFPVLALAFFVVGYVAKVFPDAQDTLIRAIDEVLGMVIGSGLGWGNEPTATPASTR